MPPRPTSSRSARASKSRIYKTNDGGATWTLQYTNRDPKGFLDALAFWDAEHGLALGDPVDGRFAILTTDDGGKSWEPIPPEGMPPALPGEGAFAASGTCLVVQGEGHAWFGTGGAKRPASSARPTGGGPGRPTRRRCGPARLLRHLLARIPGCGSGVAVGGDYEARGVGRGRRPDDGRGRTLDAGEGSPAGRLSVRPSPSSRPGPRRG